MLVVRKELLKGFKHDTCSNDLLWNIKKYSYNHSSHTVGADMVGITFITVVRTFKSHKYLIRKNGAMCPIRLWCDLLPTAPFYDHVLMCGKSTVEKLLGEQTPLALQYFAYHTDPQAVGAFISSKDLKPYVIMVVDADEILLEPKDVLDMSNVEWRTAENLPKDIVFNFLEGQPDA